MHTPTKRRLLALTSSGLVASAALALAIAGCTVHASGGAKAGSGASAKTRSDASARSDANARAKARAKTKPKSSSAASSSSSFKMSSSSSIKTSGSASGSARGSASGGGKASGSAIFKSKPRVSGLSASTKTIKIGSADLIAKIRAGATVKVTGSGKGSVSVKPSKPAVKDPKPTTPKDPKPTTPKDPKPTTPKDPKPTTPKDPKPTTPIPTPTPEPTPPVVVPIDPPAEPPDNVFGYPDPVKGCFEGMVYPLAPQTPKLPTNYAPLQQISVLYACEWDIPTREWSTGFPGVDDYFEWFAIRYSGSFSVASAGTWNFRISSDDGAKLTIDGKLVVDNDGTHPPTEKSGSIELAKGDHEMVLEYFQGPRYLINLQLYATPPGGQEGIFSVR